MTIPAVVAGVNYNFPSTIIISHLQLPENFRTFQATGFNRL